MTPFEAWESRLTSVLRETCRVFHSLSLDREVGSTQDVARTSPMPGHVVSAWRQTNGRGRLGRAWSDTGDDGVAVTFVIEDTAAERLVVASAVAVRHALQRAAGIDALIKWPNDLVVDQRKLSGILIERIASPSGGHVTLVGIGINVGQREFPPPLDQTATSCALLGASVDRCDVLGHVIVALDEALRTESASLIDEYLAADALRGQLVVVATPEGELAGQVVRAHPVEGIELVTPAGLRRLHPATVSIQRWGRAATGGGLAEAKAHRSPFD